MNRSTSRSKWKDVLGFDDGSSPHTPPTYRYKHETSSTPSASLTQYPTFPRCIEFTYHKNQQDLLIHPHYPPTRTVTPGDFKHHALTTRPLFYININEGRKPDTDIQTSKPDIVLYSGRDNFTRFAAFAKFHAVTESTDITLCPSNESGGMSRPGTTPQDMNFSKPRLLMGKDDSIRPTFRSVRLEMKGGRLRWERFYFSCMVPRNDSGKMASEKFEWRRLERKRGDVKRQIDGYHVVRTRSGDAVAVFEESPGLGGGIMGTLTFAVQEETLGGEFDIIAVMSLISVIEKERRRGIASRPKLSLYDRCGLGGLLDR